MPEPLRKRLRLNPEDTLPAAEFALHSATDAMSAFEQICLSIPASGALIAVRDPTGLRCVASLGEASEVGSRLPPDFAMALECLESDSVVSADFSDDAQRVLRVGVTMEGISQIRSAVALPMRTSGAIIGIIAVFSVRESAIQSRDIKALSRIADFWGPMMADEWFPDGIPPAIAAVATATTEDGAGNATVPEFPLPNEQAAQAQPAADSLFSEETAPAGEEPIDDKQLPAEEFHGEAAVATHDVEPSSGVRRLDAAFDRSLAPPSATVPAPLEPHRVEPDAIIPESNGSQKTPPELSPAEIGAIAAASKRFASPVFLAPAEPIPPEAFHSGEPNRLMWLVVLAVFLAVLIPVRYLRSHWNHASRSGRNSISASSNTPIASNSTNGVTATTAVPSPNLSTQSANKPGSTKDANAPSSPTAKELLPDEQMPKPLPDLNTQPDSAVNQPSAAPKPKLPAFLSRILKSPTVASPKSDANASAPTAPDIADNTPASAPAEPSATNDSASTNSAPAPPEPADLVNPAGLQPPNFALAKTLKAHSGWVSSLAFSSTGELASGSWDRRVKFWNLATGREVRSVTDKLKQIQAIAFTRDGKLLAAEDTSDTVAIFDATTGARLRELPTDKTVPSVGISWVYSIAFSPDGRWLASAVDDKTVRIWDVTTGTKIRDLAGPRRPVVYVAFSPNGELVATGNDEKSIQIWNVASGAPTTTLTGHKKVINAVAFSPDGKLLASASGDKTIRLWDVSTGKHIRTLSGHQAAVSSISFSPDGRWLASGSWDRTVHIWNVANGKELQTLRPDARAIYSVTFDPRGRWLAAGSEDGVVEIWQWNTAASNSNPASPKSKATP
jgi:WD40 repeat protein